MVARATCANLYAQHLFIILPEGFNDCIICITCSDKSCNSHMHIVCIGYKIVLHAVFRAMTKVRKQPLKLRQQK